MCWVGFRPVRKTFTNKREREREREVYFSDIKCYKVYSDGTTWNTQKFTRIDLDGYLEFAFLCIIIQKFLHVDYS